jgi:hypothetical protein
VRNGLKMPLIAASVLLAVWLAGIALGSEQQSKNRYAPNPAIQNIREGISWPAGQALPIFATPVEELAAIEVQSLTADEHYFNLYNEAHGLPFNLAMSAKTQVKSSDETTSSARATDGTASTPWKSSKDGPNWLEFDFDDAFAVSRYVIRHAGIDAEAGHKNTGKFTAQASLDGESWKIFDRVTENMAAVTDVEFDPALTRYFKIVVDAPANDAAVSTTVIEVFGAKQD